MTEPKKIMGDDGFNLSATAVRVPVQGGHSESVNIEFENELDLDEVRKILSETPGVVVLDDVSNKIYPMPLYSEGYAGTVRSPIRSICGSSQIIFEKAPPPTRYRLPNIL